MRKKIIILLLASFPLALHAQKREGTTNNSLWGLQLSKVYLNASLGLENELHFRRTDWGREKQQLLIRPSVFYQLSNQVTFQVGYTHIETYPYGKQALALRTPENNLWYQVMLGHQVGGLHFSHRYRWENRWIGKAVYDNGTPGIHGTIYRNRLRYRLGIKKELPKKRSYLKVSNEIWINVGKKAAMDHLNQNWLYGGAGHRIKERLTLEMGYLWQRIEKADGLHYESNNTLQISAFYIVKRKNQ